MTVSKTNQLTLFKLSQKEVQLQFDGDRLSSDGGALLLHEVESQIGLIERLSQAIHDQRHPSYTRHSINELLTQRIFQIAAGYEDAADSNRLRHDPIMKMAVDRDPEDDPDLASQPTISRLENDVTRPDLYRLAEALFDHFLSSYDAPPPVIILDVDDTDHETHGHQQLSLFKGYYGHRCYMPLYIYETLSGRPVAPILKSNRATGKQMLAILKRLLTKIRQRWPETMIILRGDSHFAYPEVMAWLEQQSNMAYLTGLTSNRLILKQIQTTIDQAHELAAAQKTSVTLYTQCRYQAQTWDKPRRVIARITVNRGKADIRLNVTNLKSSRPSVIYQTYYCPRGNCERSIKDTKRYLKSDRSSCHSFEANQFRLYLHFAAHILIHSLQKSVLKTTPWATATIETIRIYFLKIAARITTLKTRVKVQFAADHPAMETIQRAFQMLAMIDQAHQFG